MKKISFLFLLALLPLMASAQTLINGIYYNLNYGSKTAEVTFDPNERVRYSGNVVIPSQINYRGETYRVTSIGDMAFSALYHYKIYNRETSGWRDQNALKSVSIPNSITTIGEWAFYGCKGLTSVTIPNSVTTIGEKAFYICNNLTSVTIPSSVYSIGFYAFHNTAWYDGQPEGVIYAGKVAYGYKGTMPQNTQIVLKDGTVGIACYAFSGYQNLTDIVAPTSLISIGNSALENTTWYNNQSNGLVYVGGVVYKYKGNIPYNAVINLDEGTIGIAQSAFSNCSNLTSVLIPEGVKVIGEKAFERCTTLGAITIPSSVISIGNNAFYGCTSLTSIQVETSNLYYYSRNNCNAIVEKQTNKLVVGCKNTVIPGTVKSIGNYAYGRSGVLDITIPENVKTIEKYAFYDSELLDNVTINNGLINIGYDSFMGCKNLKSITLPNSVEEIGFGAFSGCESIASLTIPNEITILHHGVFYDCISLESIKIPAKLTTINVDAFGLCSSLSSIVVDANNPMYDSRNSCNAIIETSSNLLFRGCKNTVIPNSVTSIGNSAFVDCNDMISITIPNSITRIYTNAFCGCSNLESISLPNSIKALDSYVFQNCKGLTSVILPNDVTKIEYGTFTGCRSLTDVFIPNSVTSIGSYAFRECSSLTSITIPDKVTKIEDGTFQNCYSLVSLSIPQSVTSIGNYSFQQCRSLTSIIIPNGVTTIGEGVFSWCNGMTSVSIPNSVTSIAYSAFSNCSSLTDVYCYATSVPSTDSKAFSNSNYTNATLYVPAESLEAYKTTEPWSGFGNIVPLGDGPEVKKCATPFIAFYNGKLIFGCETPDVTYVCKLSNIEFETDGTDVSLILPSKITLAVYATKEGYEPSDPLIQEIDPRLLLDKRGDVNLDGIISMQDIMYIVQYILNGKYPDQ